MRKDFQIKCSALLLLAIALSSGAFTSDNSGLRALGRASFTLPQAARSSRAGSSVRQLKPDEWEVVVSATERWFDTGISVSSGGVLNLTARGEVTWAPPGGRNMSSTVGPNGTRPPFPQDASRFPVPDAGCGSLVMRIGSSVFAIGEARTIEVQNAGTIQLMANDDFLPDNSGSFEVNIKLLEPSQAIPQNLTAPLPEDAYRSAQGFKGTTLDPNLFHLGKDYCVDASADAREVVLKGTRFYAIGSGKVVDLRFSEPAHRSDGVGNYITIDHGNHLIAVYMHLAKVFVRLGQDVDSTTPLGEAGDVILHRKPNCGHLHLEIRKDDVTSLNVPPNLRYSYASRDGKTRYSRPLGDESAVNAWIDANFLDPERILRPRVSNAQGVSLQPPVCEPKYFLRLFNCDDGCTARLNDAPPTFLNEFFKTGFGEDSGWIDITSMIKPGENKMTFAVNNQAGAIAYGFQLRKAETMLVNEICGRVGVFGCENNRTYPVGIAKEFSRSFEGFRSVSSSEMNKAHSDWPGFVGTFRAAVNKRDLTALRGMIACPFLSQEGEFNSPDKVLNYVEGDESCRRQPNCGLWEELRKEANNPGVGPISIDSRGRPSRCTRGIFCFEFGSDGRWRLSEQVENESN